jgi:hypothetical protein
MEEALQRMENATSTRAGDIGPANVMAEVHGMTIIDNTAVLVNNKDDRTELCGSSGNE